MIFLYVLYYFIVNSNDITMVHEKTHPNYLSLLSFVIYYIIRAFGTHNVIYYVLEQGRVIWIRFFMHHSNKPLPQASECKWQVFLYWKEGNFLMGPMGNLDSVHLPKSLNSSCKCIILAKGLSSIIIELCSGIHTYY